MRKYGLLAATLLLSACAVGDDFARPAFDLPASWPWAQSAEQKAAEVKQERIPLDWWTLFGDPNLTALVEEGQKANSDLLIAAARVAQARAALGVVDTNLYPDVALEGGASRVRNSAESTFSGFAANSKPYNAFSLGAVLTYEIDLWGRLRRSSEAARARLLSNEVNRDAIRLAVSSDIASGYFNLLALDEQIRVTEDTILSREEAFGYESKQYNAGVVNELTYRQSESELASARAALPVLQQARTELLSSMAILLGRSPLEIIEGTVTRGENLADLPVPPALPQDLPSTLLERRPDVYAAEQQLVAANADVGVAKAAYFPTVSLSALLGLASSDADRLLRTSAREWNAGATVVAPLLDFPRVGYNVDRARGVKDEAQAAYQQAVRVAFKDVMDAMSAQQTSADRTNALQSQGNALSEALRVSTLRYDAGYSTYLEKLDAQRNLYQVQLSYIEAQRDRLTASVNLYKALGGGWAKPGDETAVTAEEAEAEVNAVEAAPEPIAEETPIIVESEEVIILPDTEPAHPDDITAQNQSTVENAPVTP
ncbi:MAG: efflux transporter outer membrane subunit [Alphaproteobacteria bacterium]|nr:efflux transporter outer membrane subunit [Alphaproteobacteria bacterium]